MNKSFILKTQSNILKNEIFGNLIHITNIKKINFSKKHTISYATAFNVTFKEF
ncbi:MAG: hypothetical protein U0457_07240 [Candidatus Sericytochromatia bacterium]